MEKWNKRRAYKKRKERERESEKIGREIGRGTTLRGREFN